MNIGPSLIPVAAATLDVVLQGVRDVVQAGSEFSQLLHAAGSSPDNAGSQADVAAVDGAPEVSEWSEVVRQVAMQKQYENLRQSLHQNLIRRCAQNGIDLSESAVMTVDSVGRLLESGNHMDRGAIEEMLRSDSSLRSDVLSLLELGSRLWESGPSPVDGGQPRLVISEKEIFFQVV